MRKIISSLLIIVFLLSCFFKTAPFVRATAKEDYEFQLSQYRKSYAEFSQLKRDYLQNPTLDNQQKSVIVAKQALSARDQAKASFARYLADLVNGHNTGYTAFQPILTRLSEAVVFYSAKAQESQKITTPSDLTAFSNSYQTETMIHDRSFAYGQVAAKIGNLIRFQIDAQNILNTIYPKLPSPQPIPLKARLDEIPLTVEAINEKISDLLAFAIPEEEDSPLIPDQYFSKFTEGLVDIRSRQSILIDQLIDIDINYVQP